VLDQFSPSEKRQLLFASRLRFGTESHVPRQRAINRIIQNALFLAKPDEWFSPHQIMEVFREIGGLPTLRLREIENGLQRLEDDGNVHKRIGGISPKYKLSDSAANDVDLSFQEGVRRFERVLISLFSDLEIDARQNILSSVFLEFTCDVFRALGAQWATYLKGDPLHSLIDLVQIENIANNKTHKYGIPASARADVCRRCISFFQKTDPDYDFLKFTLGQSFYIMHLLGVEGKDLLSQEIFSNGKLYLDSSVVIAAMMEESKHHRVFHELIKICQRLGISLCLTRPTADEVRAVAAQQEEIAPSLYDAVPDELSPQVSGDFFETYRAMKAVRPDASVDELFRPFHKLSETLESNFDARVVDDEKFQEFEGLPEFPKIVDILQEASASVRRRPKFKNALAHDAKVFLFLRNEVKQPTDKVWLVTRDSSLPRAWSRLQPKGLAIRCFLLDGLLQSISPFVIDEGEIREMSQVFSKVVAAQLVPQGKLFEIDDFMLFQELDLDCHEMPLEEVEESLHAVKQNVLKGATYRRENFEEAAYEVRRVLVKREERLGVVSKERNELEKKIVRLEQDHRGVVEALQSKVDALEDKERRVAQKRIAWHLFLRKFAAISLLLVSYWYVGKSALYWGEGRSIALKLISFTVVFVVDTWLIAIVAKLLLFRRQRLTNTFRTWTEVKNLFT
jgi:predicted nucleic acid-binding protein